MFTSGETVGLEEWIIDDTCFVLYIFPKLCQVIKHLNIFYAIVTMHFMKD